MKKKLPIRETTKEKSAVSIDKGLKDLIKKVDPNVSRFINEAIKKALEIRK